MTFPPSLLRLRVDTRARAWPTLWLPFLLVWPPLFLLLAPLALVVLLVAIALDPRRITRAFELAATPFAVVCGLRGLLIDVVGRRGRLLISFH